MRREKLNINGMTCGHCVMTVKKELSKLPLEIKDIKIGAAEVEFDEGQVSLKEIHSAIEEAGYEISNN